MSHGVCTRPPYSAKPDKVMLRASGTRLRDANWLSAGSSDLSKQELKFYAFDFWIDVFEPNRRIAFGKFALAASSDF